MPRIQPVNPTKLHERYGHTVRWWRSKMPMLREKGLVHQIDRVDMADLDRLDIFVATGRIVPIELPTVIARGE